MKTEYDFSKGKRGAVIPSKGKTRITIYIDDEILVHFRQRAEKAGIGYQTLINQVLQKGMKSDSDSPITEKDLRRILREELSMQSQHSN